MKGQCRRVFNIAAMCYKFKVLLGERGIISVETFCILSAECHLVGRVTTWWISWLITLQLLHCVPRSMKQTPCNFATLALYPGHMRGETRASAIVLLHARVQYSSKLMQYNACSKLYKTYCIADVAACSAFIFFFSATKHCKQECRLRYR